MHTEHTQGAARAHARPRRGLQESGATLNHKLWSRRSSSATVIGLLSPQPAVSSSSAVAEDGELWDKEVPLGTKPDGAVTNSAATLRTPKLAGNEAERRAERG